MTNSALVTTATLTAGPLPEDHAWIYGGTVRSSCMLTLTDAVTSAAEKLAKRIPGVQIHVSHADAGMLEWCDTHREYRCQGAQSWESEALCRMSYQPATAVEVSATGLPVFDGVWTVAGALRVDSEGVVTAHTIGRSDEGFAGRYVDLSGTCEHCKTTRRRSITVLLVNAAGTVRPVGKSCLAEYTGGSIRAEILGELLNVGERFAQAFGVAAQSDPDSAPVVDIVACAQILIAAHGFVGASDGGFGRAVPTVELVRRCIAPLGEQRGEVIPAELTDAQRDAARADIAAVATGDDSEYARNLAAVVAVEWAQITGRGNKLGILASLPRAAERARRVVAEKNAEIDPGQWVADLGEKVTLSGTVTGVSSFEGTYGMSWIVKVATPLGAVKMFTTARGLIALETGAEVTITGTVRSHDEFRGVRETLIGRPKLVP